MLQSATQSPNKAEGPCQEPYWLLKQTISWPASHLAASIWKTEFFLSNKNVVLPGAALHLELRGSPGQWTQHLETSWNILGGFNLSKRGTDVQGANWQLSVASSFFKIK